MAYPLQRIQNLAQRLGISFQEAAARCGRKGARRRRQQPAAVEAKPVPQSLWYLKDNQ
jgi:hypothetical protein